MAVTTNLGLSIYDTASGSATTFLAFRLAVAGNSSNMSIIDDWAGGISGSILSLQANSLFAVEATRISGNYYESSVAGITSYLGDSMINLQIDVTNTGITTININSLGVVTLKKVDVSGNLVDLDSGDLKAARYTLFIYDGTYYVMIGTTTADQVSIAGTSNYLVSISGSNTLTNSGVSASSILSEISGSGIMSTTTGSAVKHNVSGITSASYDRVIVDVYGHVTSGCQTGYTLSISGSGIMSDSSGSVVKHNVSGIISGSYNQISVDDYGHVTSGSIVSDGTSYSGSALITISGSKISHNTSTAVSGNYLAANVTIDDYGHITTIANGASASSVGAPSSASYVVLASNPSLTNAWLLSAGSSISIVQNTSASTVEINYVSRPKVYGVAWKKVSDPTLIRTDDAVGLQAFPGLATEEPANGFDTAEIYKDIDQVTDDLGNVFMRIPKFYIKKTDGTVFKTIQISTGSFASGGYLPYCFWNFSASVVLPYIDVGKYNAFKTSGSILQSITGVAPAVSATITNFRTWATNNNSGSNVGYQQLDLHTIDVLQCLFYVEFATLNSQSIVAGYTGGGNTVSRNSGDCDAVTATTGGITSLTSGSASFKYRGIEHLWGNVWQFVDGVNINNNVASVCLDPDNYVVDKWTTDNYNALSYTNINADEYVVVMGYSSDYPFAQFPTVASGGGATTYYSDYYFQASGSRIARFGGNWDYVTRAGVSNWNLSSDSGVAAAVVGARLLKKPL